MTSDKSRLHGPWKINSSADVYKDRFIHVWLDQVIRPDGNPGQHVVVTMKPGVCVLAVDEDCHVYLTSEFHYAVGRYSLEGVSGGIEPGEDALSTAKRELAEELGLIGSNFEPLTSVDPFTTVVASPTQIFLATGLRECPSELEGTETIQKVRMPLTQAHQKVRSGEISHAPTCVGILLIAERFAATPGN